MPEHRVAIVEPWFGESHAALFQGIAAHVRFDATLVTLPAKKWHWRMRFGAQALAGKLASVSPRPDALLVSDYVNLPSLLGLIPELARLPTAIYFLENQLTYPTRDGRPGDFEFSAINILSCLAATRVVFCSHTQRAAMLDAIPSVLRHAPGAEPRQVVDTIAARSSVIPIGVDLALFDAARANRPARKGQPLHIVWPHRFEHDKNPDDFFEVLLALATEGQPFEVSALGRAYRDLPPIMERARLELGARVRAWGLRQGADYAEALAAADLVVSTAWQETQGLAVIEAVRAGCDPLLPRRLSYPEVLGSDLAEKHLYDSTGELRRRLRWMCRHPERVRAPSEHWREMERFGWPVVAPQFDALIDEIVDCAARPDPLR